MFKNLSIVMLTIAGLSLSSLPTFGDLVYDLNYDVTTPTYHQFDFGGPKTLSTATGGVTGNAARLEFDNSGSIFSLSYFAEINPFEINTPDSALASDYEFSFDVKAEGLKSGVTSAGGQTEIRLGDAKFQANYNATATYTTLTFNLGAMTSVGGTFDLSDVTTTMVKPQFKVNLLRSGLSITDMFDTDAGNVLRFDNFQLTQLSAVPEPSAFLAFTLFGICVTAAGRRKK